MAYKKFTQIKAFLQNFHPEFPILLFYGDNYGLATHNAESYISLAAKNLNIKADDDFSILKFYASNLIKEPGRLLEEAKTRSFISSAKILWIKDANATFSAEITKLLEIKLVDTIIIIEAKELKATASLRKIIEQATNAMALPCLLDNDGSLETFLNKILGEYNLKIDSDTKKILLSALNSDFLLARSELVKLCTYCAKKTFIELDDIKSICIDINTIDLYRIIDYIMLGELLKFNLSYESYILNGKNSQIILGSIIKQFKDLLLFRYKIDVENRDIYDLIKNARPPIHFKRQHNIQNALKIWKNDAIMHVLSYLQKQTMQARLNTKLQNIIVQKTCLNLAKYAQQHSI